MVEVICSASSYKINDPVLFAKDVEEEFRKEALRRGIYIHAWQNIDDGIHHKMVLIEMDTTDMDVAKSIARNAKRRIAEKWDISEDELTCIVYPDEYRDEAIRLIRL